MTPPPQQPALYLIGSCLLLGVIGASLLIYAYRRRRG